MARWALSVARHALRPTRYASLVIAHGLDPYLGFLHGVVYGRPSLALDLVEEFRHPIIDRLTLNLFNNELLTQDDFRPVAENGVYLTAEGIKQYFQFYEQRLKAPFKNSKADNFRTVMKQQVLKMAQSIQNRQPYKPFKRLE